MKTSNFYKHIYILLCVLLSHNVFTTFDFHQPESFDTAEIFPLNPKKIFSKYPSFKKELLDFFSDDQEDKEGDNNKNQQFITYASDEKQGDYQHFLKTDKNKVLVLITIQSNENRIMQHKMALEATIIAAGKAVLGWFGWGAATAAAQAAALTAAEIAAVEAAKIAAAKVVIAAGGAVVTGTVIKDKLDKRKASQKLPQNQTQGTTNPVRQQKAQESSKSSST